MLTLKLQLKDVTYYYKDIVEVHIKELTYVQYEITIIHSLLMPQNNEVIVIDKDELIDCILQTHI